MPLHFILLPTALSWSLKMTRIDKAAKNRCAKSRKHNIQQQDENCVALGNDSSQRDYNAEIGDSESTLASRRATHTWSQAWSKWCYVIVLNCVQTRTTQCHNVFRVQYPHLCRCPMWSVSSWLFPLICGQSYRLSDLFSNLLFSLQLLPFSHFIVHNKLSLTRISRKG